MTDTAAARHDRAGSGRAGTSFPGEIGMNQDQDQLAEWRLCFEREIKEVWEQGRLLGRLAFKLEAMRLLTDAGMIDAACLISRIDFPEDC